MIDTSRFDLRNMWTLPGGELCVRPGLVNFRAAVSNEEIVAGFSVRGQYADRINHYLVIFDTSTSNNHHTKIVVFDEEFQQLQSLPVSNTKPRVVTHAVVTGELIISSPDFPTVSGYTGGGITVAEKVSIADRATINIPQGICASWNGRCVIADGERLFISDAAMPRTYTSAGIVALEGHIYGLHVTPGGGLVAITGNGVWGLGADAAAAGPEIIGIIDNISDHSANNYGQSALVRNQLHALTGRGLKRIDRGQEETPLSDATMSRSVAEMINFPDYRIGKVFAGRKGPIISMPGEDSVCMFDLTRGIRSWWQPETTEGTLDIVGVLYEDDDNELLVDKSRIYAFYGNTEDGDDHTTTGGIKPTGSMAGRVPTPPEASPVVRSVTTSSDNGSRVQKAAIRGLDKTKTTPTPVSSGFSTRTDGIVLTQSPSTMWGDGREYRSRELKSLRFLFSRRTDDVTVEVGATQALSRVGLVDVKTGGQGRNRP
jgi:hypothetical protein